MTTIAKRNLKVFFRDKSAVFFSLLSVFIIIGLYALFLGELLAEEFDGADGARFMMDSWIIAGIIAVTSVTSTMGAFGIMVEDKSKKIIKDFASSPLSKSSLAGGYILSTYVIGLIMSIVALIVSEVYIVIGGGELLSLTAMLQAFGVIILSVLASSSMIFFIVSFFNSQNAFATASTIIGTMIGFLTGIYIPIGTLPEGVQFVIKIFPISHAGALLRQIMMNDPISQVFSEAPYEVVLGFKRELGVIYEFGGEAVSAGMSVTILLASSMVFFGLTVLKLSLKNK